MGCIRLSSEQIMVGMGGENVGSGGIQSVRIGSREQFLKILSVPDQSVVDIE